MSFNRKIKKGDSTYLAKVESYRDKGTVRQRVIEYIGKEVNGNPVIKEKLAALISVGGASNQHFFATHFYFFKLRKNLVW